MAKKKYTQKQAIADMKRSMNHAVHHEERRVGDTTRSTNPNAPVKGTGAVKDAMKDADNAAAHVADIKAKLADARAKVAAAR